MSGIEFSVDSDNIGTLRVNRPAVRNALDWEAMKAFGEAVEQAHRTPKLHALIVTGYGDTFISGGDLKILSDFPSKGDGLRLTTIMGQNLNRLEELPCPTIAAINGPARGGGAEVAVACDLSIITENADIGFVHTQLGLITAWGGGQRLMRRIGYTHALELIAIGDVISPQRALELRVVNKVVPTGEAYQHAQDLARRITRRPLAAVTAAKRVLRYSLDNPNRNAFYYEVREFPDLWDSEFRRNAVKKFISKSKEK